MKTISKYGRTFDSRCVNFTGNRKWDLMYLKHVQAYYNDVLKLRGYVFLRDIYERLGFSVTADSVVMGWVWDCEKDIRDFIEFAIYEEESGIVIDFNTDKNILSYL